MKFSVGDLVKLYQLPTGRRAFAHTQVIARASGLEPIAAHARGARDHDRRTLELELARRSVSTVYGPEAQKLDVEVDGALAGVEGYLVSQTRAFREPHVRGVAARTLLRALFPAGNAAIARLSYVQEHEAVGALVGRARKPDLASHVRELPDLGAMLDQLGQLNARYGEVLNRPRGRGPTRDEVRAAQAQGQELIAETVVLIGAHYVRTRDGDKASELIEPVLEQNEAVRLARQRRRRPLDVHPDTGEEQPSDPDDPDEPGDPSEDSPEDSPEDSIDPVPGGDA